MRAARGKGRLGLSPVTARVLVVVGALGILTMVGAAALAFWPSAGTAAASVTTGSLNPPTNVGASSVSGSGSAAVTWTASTGTTVPEGFYVVRTRTSDSTVAAACGTSPTSLTAAAAVSCTDSFVPVGTYTYAVTAVYRGWTARSASSASVVVVVADHLAFTAQPGSGTGGTGLVAQPAVTVQDFFGGTVTTYAGSVTLALTTPGGATLSCSANPKTVVVGVATFAGCKVDRVGTYTLTATAGSLASAVSSSFTIGVGAANQLVFSTQPGSGTGGTVLGTQPSATVQDAGGNTVTTDTSSVSLALTTPGGASLTCTANPKPATAGVATFAGCKVDKTGSYTLTATDGTLGSAVSSGFTITVGAASKLGFTSQPGGGPSSSTWAAQPVVAVQDAGGNTVTTSTATVTLALTTSGGATLTCTPNARAAVAGLASFATCKADKVGTYTLTATATSLTTTVSSSFAITPGAATKLAFTAQPSSSTGGTAFGTQPVVVVQDAFGNTVTGSSSGVTLALTTSGGATLTCGANPQAAIAGVATFAGCSVDRTGTYTLTASAASVTSAASSGFTITVGTAAKLGFTTQPGGGVSGASWAAQPVVAVQDAGGNTVTTNTGTVTLTLTTPGGATLTCTANAKAAVAGVATFAGCKVDKAGSYTLTATGTSVSPVASSSFAITAGTATKLAFTTQPSGGTGGTALATQPVVTIQDVAGNTVTSSVSSVTLALTTPGGATLTCGTNPRPAVAGVATFAGCSVNKTGTYTLTSTATGLTAATSSGFTITTGTASQLMFVTDATGSTASCPTGSLAVGNGGSLMTFVALLDAGGNLVTAPSTATTITVTKGTGGGNAPTPASLTVLANASPAVTSGSTLLGLPGGNPPATTYTATAGALSTSCILAK